MDCWQKYVSLCQQGHNASCCAAYLATRMPATFLLPFLGRYTVPHAANATNSQYRFFSLCPSSLFDILTDPYGDKCAALNNWITGQRELSVMSQTSLCHSTDVSWHSLFFIEVFVKSGSIPVDVTPLMWRCGDWNTMFLLCYLHSFLVTHIWQRYCAF